MSAWWQATGVVFGLEMRQRVRGVAAYVLLGVFVLLVAGVTGLLALSMRGVPGGAGGGIFSTIIYFVLLLGTLVTPALSGNAINGDREAGTLATTQVTLVTTGQLVAGKFLASWVTALAFLAAAVPFIAVSVALGGTSLDTMVVSTLVVAVELGVVAAVGVGLSGVMTRPLLSIVVTYLTVAALSVGTLIMFGLGGMAFQTDTTSTTTGPVYGGAVDDPLFEEEGCEKTVTEVRVPRLDLVWGVLAANPYVIVADAAPTRYDSSGNATDLFGFIKVGVRSAQQSPLDRVYDYCFVESHHSPGPTAKEIIESTTPGWAVGLATHLVLAGALLWGAVAATRTPATRLPRGSRVA